MKTPPDIPVEIERKFLVHDDGWRVGARPLSIRQGYLARSAATNDRASNATTNATTVRVRITDGVATLTIKTRSKGITSPEFEYEIPTDHAEFLLEHCEGGLIEKTRHCVEHEGHAWEVDEFLGDNAGLVVAEIELESEDETFAKPTWLGEEVTHDKRFKNSRLSMLPYRDWS
jgi:adenylate cyclase